jgi:type I restriction enzyme R subunit
MVKPLHEAMAVAKVRQAAVANDDEENFGHVFIPVFEEKMMDHFDTIAELGRRYFGPDPDFRSTLNRSARRAAWRLIREQEGVLDDDAA